MQESDECTIGSWSMGDVLVDGSTKTMHAYSDYLIYLVSLTKRKT